MTIEIRIFGETATDALDELRVFAAGLMQPRHVVEVGSTHAPIKVVATADAAQAEQPDQSLPDPQGNQPGEPEKTTRKRRTKAEIEADKAAQEQAANAADPAAQAQDAADEKAEVDAGRDPAKPLTRDDVKSAMAKYVQNYGMPATQEDGPKIFREALGAPPEGETFWKLSLVPEDDQAKLAKVVEIWTKANELNPLKRAKVS